MHERVEAEINLLREKYPNLSRGDNWVLIPEYRLPPGRFNKDSTAILISLPVAYPNTGPDDFFVDGDLRFRDGNQPPALNPGSQSSSGPAPLAGNWAWFSWHPQSWRPAATIDKGDNLLSFVSSAGMCLRGEEAP
jgi:hypothetical protein